MPVEPQNCREENHFKLKNCINEKYSSNRLFIAAYLKYGKEKTWNLLTEWYSGGKNQKEKFFDKELEINDKNIEEEFRHHENWKRISGFNATPTLLFNGKKLPEAYNLDDIIYIIDNGL